VRDRRLLSGAVGLSALGDFLGFIPLALYVQERTGSGIAVAGLFIALWAPSVVLGGPAGLLADRVESRRLLRDVSLGQAAIAAVLALTFGGLAATLALTALLGVGVALAQPAEFALVPAAAGPGGVAAANGRIEAARYLGFTLGPVLGGLLAAAGGTRIALLVNAASFLAVALAAQALRARREPHRGDRSRDTSGGPPQAAACPRLTDAVVPPPARLAPATASPSCCTTACWRRSSPLPSSRSCS
jgi:predicted MFS family arabinose efflux permease